MNKIALAALAAVTLAVVPASAHEGKEAEGREFGNPGVINIGAATALDLTLGSQKAPDPGGKTSVTKFEIGVGADYFVAEGVSVGLLLRFGRESLKDEKATDANTFSAFQVGPRVGYNLWLTPGSLSLWPQLAFLYTSTSSSLGAKDGESTSRGTIDVFVPLLVHPVKHFHFAIGPFFALDVMSKAKTPAQTVGAVTVGGESVDGPKSTLFGLRAEIAGWL